MSQIVYSNGDATVAVGAGESIAVATIAEAQIYELVGFPNYPVQQDLLGTPSDNTITVFGPFTNATSIQIEAGATEVLYNVGTAPTIPELLGGNKGVAVVDIPTTAAATSTAVLNGIIDGIITSGTALAVTATLPTGAVMEAAMELAVGDTLNWAVVNYGGANDFTVAAALSGHTVGGSGVVGFGTSGSFVTLKVGPSSFETYRVA
jgi:hypothetical protein